MGKYVACFGCFANNMISKVIYCYTSGICYSASIFRAICWTMSCLVCGFLQHLLKKNYVCSLLSVVYILIDPVDDLHPLLPVLCQVKSNALETILSALLFFFFQTILWRIVLFLVFSPVLRWLPAHSNFSFWQYGQSRKESFFIFTCCRKSFSIVASSFEMRCSSSSWNHILKSFYSFFVVHVSALYNAIEINRNWTRRIFHLSHFRTIFFTSGSDWSSPFSPFLLFRGFTIDVFVHLRSRHPGK